MIADALKLSVYFGEAIESGPLMDRFDAHNLTAAALTRGIEGFGMNRRIHAERFPDVSTDLPLLAWGIDTRERIMDAMDDIDRVVPRGLVTFESARLATGRDVAGADFPDGPGQAGKLTIYCGADEPYRRAVALLREHGASGAIVLPGVDGRIHGARRRAHLLSRDGRPPMIIISVGPLPPLRRALPHLAEVLTDPVVTLEPIAQLKHDGEHLEPLPAVADDAWNTIRVYTRRTAHVDGHSLYTELTRRLREAGAAGATTILGDWGFSSDEHPHGDRLGRIASHRPTYTIYIDRPARVAALWPLIDEVTAEHGIVTSLPVPGYRELPISS